MEQQNHRSQVSIRRLRALPRKVRTKGQRILHTLRSRLPGIPTGQRVGHAADDTPVGDTTPDEASTNAESEHADTQASTVESTEVVTPETPAGTTPEEFVIGLLEVNGGALSWQTVCDELGWSDGTSRDILRGMEDDGEIVVHGQKNCKKTVALPHLPKSAVTEDESSEA